MKALPHASIKAHVAPTQTYDNLISSSDHHQPKFTTSHAHSGQGAAEYAALETGLSLSARSKAGGKAAIVVLAFSHAFVGAITPGLAVVRIGLGDALLVAIARGRIALTATAAAAFAVAAAFAAAAAFAVTFAI